jgi:dihydroflavonol-4-reductase
LVRAETLRGLGGTPLGDELASLGVELRVGELGEPDTLAAGFAGAGVVYHLAAFISILGGHDGKVWATNVEGARAVGAAARACGVRRLVHCSSVHAFDLGRGGVVDEASPRAGAGHAEYDRSKVAGEAALREAAGSVEVVVGHPTGVIGPPDFGPSRMGRFLLGLAQGRVPALVAGGFDWVDVRDVAAGLHAAAQRGRAGESYLLGGAHARVRELADLVAATTGVRAPRFVTPMALARFGALFTTAYGRLSRREPLYTSEALAPLRFAGRISSDKARRELGYTTRPLAETIAETCRWFRGDEVPEAEAPVARVQP